MIKTAIHLTCDHPGCGKQGPKGETPAWAIRFAANLGWQVRNAGQSSISVDLCPDHVSADSDEALRARFLGILRNSLPAVSHELRVFLANELLQATAIVQGNQRQ